MSDPRPIGGSTRTFLAAGGVAGLLGVALGAFGAHELRDTLPADSLAVFETGVRYQMYHALALFAAAWCTHRLNRRAGMIAGWSFIGGIALFSGSLYLLAITGTRWFGILTPFGGLCFLVGWIALIRCAVGTTEHDVP